MFVCHRPESESRHLRTLQIQQMATIMAQQHTGGTSLTPSLPAPPRHAEQRRNLHSDRKPADTLIFPGRAPRPLHE
ncbi:hypothetical protein E2C01_092934 [Portunus trituberculatus]|uniref:Uncharacterized protein n=1 Tax=Portunus trituberculatus TaxID=210409 RepID=A0A5B7JNH3_PORTR|nr:hypothetical protein [Portunus trituberculatus]